MIGALVCGLHLRWDGVRQRPHHLLSRFARHVPIVVIEEPFIGPDERDELFREGNLTVVRPIRREHGADALIDARAIATARTLLGGANPAVWLYTPMMTELADAFPGTPLAYDCMDDLAAFAFAPPALAAREGELLDRADVVFTGGKTLYAQRASFGEKVHCEPSGVEFEHFAAAQTRPVHSALAALAPPRLGYVGVIDERVDLGLVLALAEHGYDCVLVGPVVKIDPLTIPRHPRVHLTGQLPYAELPAVLAGLELALMPFALNRHTRAISPTKTLEYLAAGVPVLSTPIADVVSDYADVVTIAGPDAFVDAVPAALVRDAARITAGIEIARERGWDAIATRMWTALRASAKLRA